MISNHPFLSLSFNIKVKKILILPVLFLKQMIEKILKSCMKINVMIKKRNNDAEYDFYHHQ